MPNELTVIAIIALVVGLIVVAVTLTATRPGRRVKGDAGSGRALLALGPRAAEGGPLAGPGGAQTEARAPEGTLRVVWWLTLSIVMLGVGISGAYVADSAAISLLAAAAVLAVIVFHELAGANRSSLLRLAEVVAAVALIGGLLALTGYASSAFSMLFALVAVAAALAYGPRAGLLAAILATAAYGAVLYADPQLRSYTASDALRLSIGLVATWLLTFVAVAYAARQRRAIATVLALSRTDPLTGLFNRSQLFVTLEQEVNRTRRSDRGFCVLMIDLDGLKAVNDGLGHLRGDDLLRALGNVIRHSIRTVDSAYRYGGDEFVVLLPETDIVGAFVVAEKIRSGAEDLALSLASMLGPDPITSVSIGLVSHPEDGFSAEELMTAADRAMYQAKKLGKNQISGNPRSRPALIARRAPAPSGPAPSREPRGGVEEAPAAPRTDVPPAPREDRAVAVELGPVVTAPPAPPAEHSSAQEPEEEDLADAGEVRRQIAAASRSFDPDHQIRRAMDAFLSPVGPDVAERRTPDH